MQETEFSLQHLKLAGLCQGQSSKPVILALHGWLDNAASFLPVAAYLHDYQLIAVDLPGHGHSQHRSADAHYHLMDWVQDLHELIESQGWQQVILLGHSMGGIISSLYASCFPEKVAAFISIEAAGPLVKEAQSSPEQLRESVISRLAAAQKQPRHPSSMSAAVKARMNAGDMDEGSATLLIERNLSTVAGQLMWRSDPRLRTVSSLRMTTEQAKAFLGNIQCPMLLITGDKGFEKIKVNLAARRDWVNQLQHREIEGGHHVHMDNPEAVSGCILEFLATVSA